MARMRDLTEALEKRLKRKEDSIRDFETKIKELKLTITRTNDEINYTK